ncbi:unnamed protein product, partial [Laminaria digitata]
PNQLCAEIQEQKQATEAAEAAAEAALLFPRRQSQEELTEEEKKAGASQMIVHLRGSSSGSPQMALLKVMVYIISGVSVFAATAFGTLSIGPAIFDLDLKPWEAELLLLLVLVGPMGVYVAVLCCVFSHLRVGNSPVPAVPATADIMDNYKGEVQVAANTFRDYGRISLFSGRVETVICSANNNLLLRRRLTEEDGRGMVLVVDGEGALVKALLGYQLDCAAVKMGWEVI